MLLSVEGVWEASLCEAFGFLLDQIICSTVDWKERGHRWETLPFIENPLFVSMIRLCFIKKRGFV